VLVHKLSACTSLLYTKRLASTSYQAFRRNIIYGAFVIANPEADDGMLASLVKLPNLLDTFVWKVSYYSTR
jgi:serine/threonine-protein phosphatase 6 regulatory subunit 3